MSDLDSIIEADDLENLKRQVAYTFLDAYGNFDGADILFDAIVTATEKRIIKLLEEARDKCDCYEVGMPVCRHTPTIDETIALIEGEK